MTKILAGGCMNVARPSDMQGERAGRPRTETRDFPLCRALTHCPICLEPRKPVTGLMCWPCWRDGGKEGALDPVLMDMELHLEAES